MPKKEKVGVDRLARMVQREFTTTRSEIKETREDIRLLRNDLEAGFAGVSHTMGTIADQLRLIREDVVETPRPPRTRGAA